MFRLRHEIPADTERRVRHQVTAPSVTAAVLEQARILASDYDADMNRPTDADVKARLYQLIAGLDTGECRQVAYALLLGRLDIPA